MGLKEILTGIAKPSKQNAVNPIGVTGLKHSLGRVNDEFLPDLKGARGRKVYQEMSENEAVIRAILYAIETIVKGQPMEIEAGEGDADLSYSDWFQAQWMNQPFTYTEFIEEVLTQLVYGYSLFEIVLGTLPDGRLGLVDLPPRKQSTLSRWEIDTNGKVLGFYQNDPITFKEIFIPEWKLLHFKFTNSTSPEGRPLLRGAYKAYTYKKNTEHIEAIGLERDFTGIPVIKLPAELMNGTDAQSTAAVEEWKKIGTDVVKNNQTALMIPSNTFPNLTGAPTNTPMYSIELLSSPSTRLIDTSVIIDRHEKAMSRIALADFIMLGSTAAGSFALSKDKSALFIKSLESMMTKIEEALNRQVIKLIWDLNGFKPETMPRFKAPTIGQVELADVLQVVQTLALSNGGTEPAIQKALLEMAGLPSEDETAAVSGA